MSAMNNIYSIYCITNLINQKVYIGFTSKTVEDRYAAHIRAARNKSNTIFHRSIRKYGVTAFTVECLYQSYDEIHTKETMETYFIKEFNSMFTSGCGYNMIEGGTGGKMPDYIIRQMVWARKKDNSFVRSPESIIKMMASRKRNGTINTSSLESVIKMIESRKRNGTLNVNSPNATQKKLETRRKNGTWNAWTEESSNQSRKTKIANNTLNSNTEESKSKRLATRIANGTDVKEPCCHCGSMISKAKQALHKRSSSCLRNR